MKLYAVFLVAALPVMQAGHVPSGGPSTEVKVWSLDDWVRAVPLNRQATPAENLVELGIANHLPTGIVGNAIRTPSLCVSGFDLPSGAMTVRDLIQQLNNGLPGMKAALNEGTLEIIPDTPQQGTTELLRLHLDFRSPPQTRFMVGVNLWGWIRAKLYPELGSAYAGGLPASKMISAVSVRDTSVETILNILVQSQGGGLWYLDTADLKVFDPRKSQPFVLYGYDGDEAYLRSLGICKGRATASK